MRFASSNNPQEVPLEAGSFPPAFFPGAPQPPELKLRDLLLSVSLFVATFFSTTFAGILYAGGDADFFSTLIAAIARPSLLLLGLPFSFTFLGILLAHEMGHFLACRYYGIRCTPPYFIPLPISIAGTLGAFIRIKSPFLNKRALFDVGVAGPLAGFVFTVPALIVGIANSQLIPKGSVHGGLNFGEPLIFRWIGKLVLGYSPASQDMMAHPIAMAAWYSLLATSLNLFPIWQLDGGHIAYAILGRETQKRLSVITSISLVLISFLGWPIPTYLLFGMLLLIVGARVRFYHPPTIFDHEMIGAGRLLLGIIALTILIISFTPVPLAIG